VIRLKLLEFILMGFHGSTLSLIFFEPLVEHPCPPKQVTTMPLQGKVARWDEDKNFGFIAYSTGSVFVHHSDLIGQKKLQVGQRVSFEIVVNASCGKHKAVRVSVLQGDENTDIDIAMNSETTLSSMPSPDSSSGDINLNS